MKNAGYTGSYWSPLGPIPPLYSTMAGTVTIATYNNAPNAGLTAMQNAMNAVSPGTQLASYSNVPSYLDTAMFATAVRTVQAKKQAITPANVRAVLSTIKWGIPGLVGPISYPASTVAGTPYCTEFLQLHRRRRPAGLPLLLQLQGLQGDSGGREGQLTDRVGGASDLACSLS